MIRKLATLGMLAVAGAVVAAPVTYNIDPDAVQAAITPRTRALIPVDFAGHPAELDRIMAVGKARGLTVVAGATQPWMRMLFVSVAGSATAWGVAGATHLYGSGGYFRGDRTGGRSD